MKERRKKAPSTILLLFCFDRSRLKLGRDRSRQIEADRDRTRQIEANRGGSRQVGRATGLGEGRRSERRRCKRDGQRIAVSVTAPLL